MSPKKKQSKAMPHSLQSVTGRELGIELDKQHQTADWSGELSNDMLEYAAKDAQVLLLMAENFESKLRDEGLEKVSEIEHRALPAVVWMQNAGLPLDVEGWRGHLAVVEQEKHAVEEELNRSAPGRLDGKRRNWNSHVQVKEAFGLLGVDLPDTKEETLRRYDHLLAQTLLRYKALSKILNTFGESLLEKVEDGRLYGSWHQIGAETGRMSCSKPNLQQLPREVKRYVQAPEGRALIAADYSQAELRIAARISGDEGMLEACRKGEDLHAVTAKSLMGRENITKAERDLAKAVNFGLLYGQGAPGLREYARNRYGITMTKQEAARYRRRFFETYPGLKAWHEKHRRELRQGSTETRTLSGRRRAGVTKFTERTNAPVQGTGADGLKLALALLRERRHLCPGAFPVACVHDEIVVECDEKDVDAAASWLEQAMNDGMAEVLDLGASGDRRVPVEVEVKTGKTWDSGQPWSTPASEHDVEEEPTMEMHFYNEPVEIKLYIDYRDLSLDNYPQIALCDECAESLEPDVCEQDTLGPDEDGVCDRCGLMNAAALRATVSARGACGCCVPDCRD